MTKDDKEYRAFRKQFFRQILEETSVMIDYSEGTEAEYLKRIFVELVERLLPRRNRSRKRLAHANRASHPALSPSTN